MHMRIPERQETFKTRLKNEGMEAEFEILPFDSCSEDYESAFLQEIQEKLEEAHEKLNKYDKSLDRLTEHADRVDYFVAASCGILTGLIDIFFIRDAQNASELGSKPVNSFVEHFARKMGYSGEDGLVGAIRSLEGKFGSPTDAIWKGTGINTSTHHLDDYSHHPTLVGLICSVLTQFTKVGYFQNRDGATFKISITNEGLIGETFWGKIGAGIINWFGHLVSDMAGSRVTPGAGMGIPGPFMSLAKEFAALPGIKDSGLSSTLCHMFKDHNANLCFDLRCEVGQSIPVLTNICLVTVFYMIRRIIFAIRAHNAGETVNLTDIIPSSSGTYARMMTIASGVFMVTDIADAGIEAAIKGGANPAISFADFACRVNIVGIGHFAIALGKDVSMGIKRERKRDQRIKLYNEIIALTNAKILCLEHGIWEEAKDSYKAIEILDQKAQKSYCLMAQNWNEITTDLSTLSEKREDIQRKNPGLLDDLEAELNRPKSLYNMTDITDNMFMNVQMDIHTSPEELTASITKQVKIMEFLDQKITEAKEKVVAAQQKANEAKHKIRLFNKKQSIEDLQTAVLAQSDAIAAEDEAMRISFHNQKMLADVSTGLLSLGLVNLVSNRTVFQGIKNQLQQASEEEINEHAREELKKIVSQLKAQEDIYNRIDQQAHIVEDIQIKIRHIETQKELMGRNIREVGPFAVMTFILAMTSAIVSILHVLGMIS